MKLLFALIVSVGFAAAQSNELQLCDQQANPHCILWNAGSTLAADKTITGPVLPLTGDTMTGMIRLSGGYGNSIVASIGSNYEADTTSSSLQSLTDCTFPAAFNGGLTYNLGDVVSSGGTTYTSLANSNTGNTPPNATWWTPACVDDRTRIDWFGMEGDFIRIKGKGNNTIGDYFDWTRFTAASSALPLHQVNFNDSSFNTLIHIDESVLGYPLATFDFAGTTRWGLGATVDVGITRNAANVLEVDNGTPIGSGGSYASLKLQNVTVNGACTGCPWTVSSGNIYPTANTDLVLVGRNTADSSGAWLEIAGSGSVGSINAGGVIQSVATGTNLAFQANSGTFQVLGNGLVGAANYNVGTSGVIEWNGQSAFRYNSGHVQFSDDGSTWNNIAGGTSQWTLTGTYLYPNSTSDVVGVGRTTDDSSGAAFQVNGGGNFSTVVQSPIVRVATSADHFDWYQNGTAHDFRLLDGSAHVLANYTNGTASWQLGDWLINVKDFYLNDPINSFVFASLTNSSSGTSTNYRGRLTLNDEPASTSIILDANQAGGGNPEMLMNAVGSIRRTSSTVLQWSNDGSTWNNFAVAPVSSVTGSGSGISVSPTTGAVVVQNTGVTSAVAGTAISVSGATGAVTINNTGVTAVTGTSSGVLVNGGTSSATGSVSLSLDSSLQIAGQYYSTASGTNNSFLNNNMQILGNGNMGTNGYVNAIQGFGVNGVSNAISNANVFVGQGINLGGAGAIFIADNSGNVLSAGYIGAGTVFKVGGVTGISGETITTSGGTRHISGGIIVP